MKKKLQSNKTKFRFYQIFGGAILLGMFLYFSLNKVSIDSNSEEYEKEPEEELPEEGLFNPEELNDDVYNDYLVWKSKLKESGNKFSDIDVNFDPERGLETIEKDEVQLKSAPTSMYSYVNGRIKGKWQQKSFTNGGGYRVDGSVYDPVNEDVYAISYAGHLYKIDTTQTVGWSLRNHSMSFKGRAVSGINLSDGSFRMLYQKSNGGMMYSDDEGRAWQAADGALFENGWNHKTEVVKYTVGGANSKRIVAHGSNYLGKSGYYRFFFSTDYGLNYTQSALSWARSSHKVFMCKTLNTQEVCVLVWNKNTHQISIYSINPDEEDFTLVATTTQTFSDFTKAFSTYANGSYHLYVHAGTKNIYYSNDKGVIWTQTASNNSNPIKAIHPTQPNICFKGFTQLQISRDYGATWEKNAHKLNTYYTWDLQHMKIYEKEDGTDVALAGLDFGFYYSEAPDDWKSWRTLNVGSPIPMCYDAVSSDLNNVGYIACQDKGTNGFVDDGGENGAYKATNVASTDVLRVALAKNESSVWYWYYYGKIERSDVNANASKSNKKGKDPYGNWWASTMVGSPDQNEDAVYIATGTQLEKFTYNPTEEKVTRSYHPYVFSEKITSFGYSKLNNKRWYVALKSGILMYSTDGGNTFTQGSYSGKWPQQESSYKKTKQVIKASPVDELTVYYAGKGNRFLISTDGGQTFTNHANGLKVTRFRDFDISPDGKYVFAACAGAGAWVYSVQDNYWYKLEALEVPNVDFTDAQFIVSKNIVRFSTYGSGIIDLNITESDIATSIKQTTKETWTIFPNPVLDVINIKGGEETLASQVVDINGKVLMQFSGNSAQVSQLKSGVYFLKIKDYDVIKFIKK